MTNVLTDTKDGKTPYLKCKGNRSANINCLNNKSIRCDVLEKLVLDEINNQLDKYYNLDVLQRLYALQKNSSKSVFTREESLEIEKKDITNKLNKRNEHYKKLYEDKLDGIINQDEFLMFREKNANEIEECKKRINIINEELSTISSEQEKVKNSQTIFEKYKHIDKLNKEIIDEFIDTVWIGKINLETNVREIDVEMNIINLD